MKLEELKDKYKGETCLVLNCGPSLNDYGVMYLTSLSIGKIVATVKQGILKGVKPDIHFFNCSNLEPPVDGVYYDYDKLCYNRHPISIASSNYPQNIRLGFKQHIDIFFPVPITGKWLAKDLDWDTNNFYNYKGFLKPYPGIMGESVLFSLLWMGFSECIIVGWDLTKSTKREEYKHCYENRELHIPGSYNKWEIDLTRESSASLYYYFMSKGMKIKLLSEQSTLYSGIERIKI